MDDDDDDDNDDVDDDDDDVDDEDDNDDDREEEEEEEEEEEVEEEEEEEEDEVMVVKSFSAYLFLSIPPRISHLFSLPLLSVSQKGGKVRKDVRWEIPQQNDLRLLVPPSGRGTVVEIGCRGEEKKKNRKRRRNKSVREKGKEVIEKNVKRKKD
ncbi:hypothetical protein PoB_006092500 [Plakobranchus ocellatus]|uniref:Uncharacterized protein n=1 Tax=Plakobranchus ocellatus TaxID=259542 RepID=A0AAV4CRF8_9GAST|nr:hypothetical protein PoB_006092500 [Plakobranchus ocellatus]